MYRVTLGRDKMSSSVFKGDRGGMSGSCVFCIAGNLHCCYTSFPISESWALLLLAQLLKVFLLLKA